MDAKAPFVHINNTELFVVCHLVIVILIVAVLGFEH